MKIHSALFKNLAPRKCQSVKQAHAFMRKNKEHKDLPYLEGFKADADAAARCSQYQSLSSKSHDWNSLLNKVLKM